MRHLESKLQRQVVKHIKEHYPHVLCFAVPNGGKRSKIEAAIMKGEGVLAGVSDLLFFWDDGTAYHKAAIELKVGKNKESDPQKAFATKWCSLGGEYAVCRSLDDVIAALKAWRVPVRPI